jgi:putative solute:sodium symporter small subunit
MDDRQREEYWRRNVRLMVVLLSVWALVSFGASILFVEPLNNIVINDFPLGFWFAQQGSIITFVILIGIYVWRMDRMDDEYGISDRERRDDVRVEQ